LEKLANFVYLERRMISRERLRVTSSAVVLAFPETDNFYISCGTSVFIVDDYCPIFTAHAQQQLFGSFRSRHSLRGFPVRQMHFHYRVTCTR